MKVIYCQMMFRVCIIVLFVLLMVVVMGFVVVVEQLDYDELCVYVIFRSLYDEMYWLQLEFVYGMMLVFFFGSQFYDSCSVFDDLCRFVLGYYSVDLFDVWYLLVFDGDGQCYYFWQDVECYQYLEYVIDGYVLVVILLCILCVFWIGWLIVVWVIVLIIFLVDVV